MRGLIRRLEGGNEPLPFPDSVASPFDDASARNRVGLVVSRAVIGDPLYQLYRVYLGDPGPPNEV